MIKDLEKAVSAAMAVHCRKPIPGTRSLHCTLLAGHNGPCPTAKIVGVLKVKVTS